jgi:hypothetical protein
MRLTLLRIFQDFSAPLRFFALNIDTPNRLDDLYKREEITRAILQSIDALPAEEDRK